MKEIAVRNLRLCTKDCLCLYVCPVGATDTENSIIDVIKEEQAKLGYRRGDSFVLSAQLPGSLF